MAESIAVALRSALQPLPEALCGSFAYTTTGKNLSHPIVWGELVAIVRSLPGVRHVGIDVRLNAPKERVKFQPDIVAYEDSDLLRPVLIVDYESPNSSDFRIIEKDILAYRKWCSVEAKAPYIIVTTLPNCECKHWELRWTAADGYNRAVRHLRDDLRRNPLAFWTTQWKQGMSADLAQVLENISIVNIDRKSVEVITLHP